MPIPLRPPPECPPSGFEPPEAGERCRAPPAPERRSWFGRAFGGVRWLAAAPGEWLGVRVLSRGGSFISGLAGLARAGAARDRRFKVDADGGFDLRASAFSYGMSVHALDARLRVRRRQTALLAYALFALALLFLLAWARATLSAPLSASRVMLAFEFLPFGLLFFLMAFYQALVNFQIRVRRTAGWREYLTTDEKFLPR